MEKKLDNNSTKVIVDFQLHKQLVSDLSTRRNAKKNSTNWLNKKLSTGYVSSLQVLYQENTFCNIKVYFGSVHNTNT